MQDNNNHKKQRQQQQDSPGILAAGAGFSFGRQLHHRWRRMMEGGDALELQPLQHQPRHHQHPSDHGAASSSSRNRNDVSNHQHQHATGAPGYASAAAPGSLEMILGLEEPIRHHKSHAHYHDDSDSNASSKWWWWWQQVVDWLFYPDDDDQPHAVQVWRLENVAIPASYLVVGILQGMMRPVLNVYPLDLHATEAQQTTLASIATLPSALKILFGFWSDNVTIAGRRRKPYMLLGWLTVSASMAVLLWTSDLTLYDWKDTTTAAAQDFDFGDADENDDALLDATRTTTDNTNARMLQKPSMEWLMLVFFLTGCGMWMADVMADSLVAQKVPLEPAHRQGHLQATCYTCRFLGLMVAAPISTYLYSRRRHNLDDGAIANSVYSNTGSGPASAVWVILITPLLLLPLIYLLAEEKDYPVPSTAHQCREIWKTICSRSVWQPIGFLYLFNLLHLPNAAWRQYLKTVLGFAAAQLNALLVASYVMLYTGTVTYKYLFMRKSWRRIYQACILLNCAFSCSQLLLIRGKTFGLSPFLFSLGDEVLQEFIVGIQFLPVSILMVTLCPPGSEGASYAMFTTTWNSAMVLAPAISSSYLLGIWDVSKEAMEAGELDGLFNLTILTTLLQVSPIFFLGWLPHGRDDLHALSDPSLYGSSSSSKVGGVIFLLVIFAGLFYTIAVALLNVLSPGWAGES